MDLELYNVIFLSDEQLKLGNPHAKWRPCIVIKISDDRKKVTIIHTTKQYKENFEQFELESCPNSFVTIEQEISYVHIQEARAGMKDNGYRQLTNKDIENINKHFHKYM